MPYRIDIPAPPSDAFESLITLGALDVDVTAEGLAAIMPDAIDVQRIAAALRVTAVRITPAVGRDAGSVWTVNQRPARIARWQFVPADAVADGSALRMLDGPSFGTGLHPTTALCLEALDLHLAAAETKRMLDVGTGSGILALAALQAGVARVVALDHDGDAVAAAAANAALNGLSARLLLVCGGPEALSATWPLVMANILAAPLIELAPALVRRLGAGGRLVLSGIPDGVGTEVAAAYTRLGLRLLGSQFRSGWCVLTLQTSW